MKIPTTTTSYRVNYDGTGLRRLDRAGFDGSFSLSDDCRFFTATCSRVDTAPASDLYSTDGRRIDELEKVDLEPLFAIGYKFPEPFTVKAADGVTDLYGVMYKPYDFDPSKRYPIIEYVYPGPQTEAVDASWSLNMNRIDRLAQIGFVVITVGNRGGHPDRSKWYHNYGYGNLRDYGLKDKVVAAQQLAARYPWIDIDRVGIHGHSGGGFMSTAAILMYPDFFKAAVSCAGNHDNRIYNRWWSEKHHGIKEQIDENGDTTFVYKISTNPELASRLKGAPAVGARRHGRQRPPGQYDTRGRRPYQGQQALRHAHPARPAPRLRLDERVFLLEAGRLLRRTPSGRARAFGRHTAAQQRHLIRFRFSISEIYTHTLRHRLPQGFSSL